MKARRVTGGILCLVGLLWIGQGVGAIGGSFMTGQGIWTVIGAVSILVGLYLLRRRR